MRLRSAVATVLASAFCLSGCSRSAHHAPVRNPAIAPTGALNAGGEPQWSAQVRQGQLRFSTGEGPELSVQAAVTDHGKAGAVWSGSLPPAAPGRAGRLLRLSVLAKPCQDGSTGMGYPLTATAIVEGRRYDGCAAAPGQGLGPRT